LVLRTTYHRPVVPGEGYTMEKDAVFYAVG